MSKFKYSVKMLWEERYGRQEEVLDYAGRRMVKAACSDCHSSYQPTIDHIRPLSAGGKDVKENIVICAAETNWEKGCRFPHWQANGKRYHARRKRGVRGGYLIIEEG